jgi:hypothetical protein
MSKSPGLSSAQMIILSAGRGLRVICGVLGGRHVLPMMLYRHIPEELISHFPICSDLAL